MANLEGSCIGLAANSGTLTVEIHLSPDAPQEVIQRIQALVVDSPSDQEIPRDQPGVVDGKYRPKPAASSYSSVNAVPQRLKLIPVEGKTGKPSLMATLAVLLIVCQITYYVSGTADHTIEFIELYQRYIQETKVNGSVVPIDQVKKTIKTEEHPQTTPSAISSEGD